MDKEADAVLMLAVSGSDAVLPITHRFIAAHLDNSVVPRLFGLETVADGLCTRDHQQQRNDKGYLTILADLGIEHDDMLHLMEWLRTGHLHEAHRPRAYETSLKLGGLSKLDQIQVEAIGAKNDAERTDEAAKDARKHQLSQPRPMVPSADTRSEYQWVCININHAEQMLALAKDGWSATGPGETAYSIYLCRPVADR